MHNLMRFIRQNKKQIIRVALFVAFLILLLQVLNNLPEKEIKKSTEVKNDIYEESNGKIITLLLEYNNRNRICVISEF